MRVSRCVAPSQMSFSYSGSTCSGTLVSSNMMQPAGCTQVPSSPDAPPGVFYAKAQCGSAVAVPTAYAFAHMEYASQSDCAAGAAPMMATYMGLMPSSCGAYNSTQSAQFVCGASAFLAVYGTAGCVGSAVNTQVITAPSDVAAPACAASGSGGPMYSSNFRCGPLSTPASWCLVAFARVPVCLCASVHV